MKRLTDRSAIKTFLFCCIVVLFVACQGTKSEQKKCPLGEPTPVYSSDYHFVNRHFFERDKQMSEERIEFSDGLYLTIRQSGCQSIRQDYIFSVPTPTDENNQFWVEESIRLFSQLGRYSEKFYSFNQWSNKIHESKSEIRLTEPFTLAPGILVKIDRIGDFETTKLIVSLIQQ
jgi:hypothetical protein